MKVLVIQKDECGRYLRRAELDPQPGDVCTVTYRAKDHRELVIQIYNDHAYVIEEEEPKKI